MKILINTPKTTIPAGVSNHYLGLRPYFSNDVIYNQYLPGTSVKQIAFDEIIIGNNVTIAEFVTILDHDHAYNYKNNVLKLSGYKTGKIHIGSNVWGLETKQLF